MDFHTDPLVAMIMFGGFVIFIVFITLKLVCELLRDQEQVEIPRTNVELIFFLFFI